MQQPWLVAGLTATLAFIVILSVWSGTGGKAYQRMNLPEMTGFMMGSLIGGSTTVGTAQIAYYYGLSGLWYAVGTGIACLLMVVIYVRPLRRCGMPTLMGLVRREFGPTAGMLASVLNTVGSFINIVSQIMAATAVLSVAFPTLSLWTASALSALFMVLYILFGGVKGAGLVGVAKTVLIYAAVLLCGALALSFAGGFSGFVEMVKGIENPEQVNFFSPVARGVGTDLGAVLSLILGIFSTQTSMTGILNAQSDRVAQGGVLLAGLLIPFVGIGSVLVGLYMRANALAYPGLVAKTALTTFVAGHIPPLLAGVVLGALFITAVGGGAGLTLAVVSVVGNDIVGRFTRRVEQPDFFRTFSRGAIVAVLTLACCLSTGALGDVIVDLAFLSLGLRAAAVLCPLWAALYFPGKVDRRFICPAIVSGPVMVLVGKIMGVGFDPLFLGLAASAALTVLGWLTRRRKNLI